MMKARTQFFPWKSFSRVLKNTAANFEASKCRKTRLWSTELSQATTVWWVCGRKPGTSKIWKEAIRVSTRRRNSKKLSEMITTEACRSNKDLSARLVPRWAHRHRACVYLMLWMPWVWIIWWTRTLTQLKTKRVSSSTARFPSHFLECRWYRQME